ncbi:NB-ARC domain-containing protein [Kibdelosporangium philippinense]|uniref:NB-ARC domain-containing protein n=1 Tax=Kibdelosporangium philippinense TaxID=211113 RepID=A0ABS8ZG30_9PSEU|nr:BTAD domain-containing putative transcriptional regulator [Kibdelosporangium philippinense]MCE7006234.1 NB-ARC domain-containing protein [Kibdelosporangium philippinense]
MPAVRIHDHFETDWVHAKPRGMFSVLLLRAREPVSVTELTDWIWPVGKAPDDPSGALSTYKKRIVAGLARMNLPPRIFYRNGSYRLDVDREEIDFHEFCRRAEKARSAVRQGDHANAVRELTSAVDDLWTGTPIPDLHGERAANWRHMAISEHLIPAHSALFTCLSVLGEHEQVLRRLAELPVELRQNLTMLKHRLAAQHGARRFGEADSFYLDQRKRLKNEGSLDEADELTRFQNELLARKHDQRIVLPTPPAPPQPAEAPYSLPHDVNDFFGRESLVRELDRVTTASDGVPTPTIVVLSGDPGVGKTALAVRWAHLAADRYPGGRLYRDLNGFGEGHPVHESEVVDEFLATLGLSAEAMASPMGRKAKLRGLLSGKRALVVLDNVRDHNQIRQLLDCLSTCTVLVTSRSRLPDLVRRGASTVPVQPLTYAEGKAWLTTWLGPRALAEVTATSDLVALCGGIALVLRIVAERTRSRPGVALAEFADELRDEHTMLGLGGRGAEGSVRAALGWSYNALRPAEQRVFRLLGVHPGPDVSVEAAAALTGQDRKQIQGDLDALVDFHMVSQPESLTRYRLHDLLRRYAHELAAEADETPAAERRLFDFYLSSAQNADRLVIPHRMAVDTGPSVAGVAPIKFTDKETVSRWAHRERANINELIRYAAARGHHHFAMQMPSVIGEIFQRLGHGLDVVAALRIAVRSARIAGDLFEEACSWGNLGFHQLALRQFDAATDSLQTARTMFNQVNDPVGMAATDMRLGMLAVEQRDFRRAIELQLSALRAFQRLRAAGEEALALSRLTETYRRSGNLTDATEAGRETVWCAERIGDTHTKGRAFIELAAIHAERGALAEAKDYCLRALETHDHNDLGPLGAAYNVLAVIHVSQEDYQAAEQCARRALTHCRGAFDIRGKAQAHRMIAELMHRQARHEEAAESWTLALSLFEAMDDHQAATGIRERLAEIPAVALIPAERTESLQHPPARFTTG